MNSVSVGAGEMPRYPMFMGGGLAGVAIERREHAHVVTVAPQPRHGFGAKDQELPDAAAGVGLRDRGARRAVEPEIHDSDVGRGTALLVDVLPYEVARGRRAAAFACHSLYFVFLNASP